MFTHCDDIVEHAWPHVAGKPKPKCLLLVVDSGTDFAVSHVSPRIAYWRMFKKLQLDVLIATAHAPGFSAFNIVERVWAPTNERWVGLSTKSPEEFHGTKDEKETEAALSALNLLQQRLDGHKMTAAMEPTLCISKTKESNIIGRISDDDNGKIVSGNNMMHDPQLAEELKEIEMHLDRRRYTIMFRKCDPMKMPCSFCSASPASTRFHKYLAEFSLPDPEPQETSQDEELHYKPYDKVSFVTTVSIQINRT